MLLIILRLLRLDFKLLILRRYISYVEILFAVSALLIGTFRLLRKIIIAILNTEKLQYCSKQYKFSS